MVQFIDLQMINWQDAYDIQCRTVSEIADQISGETVHLLEHPHVFTVGRRGLESNLLVDRDLDGNPISIVRINRGGDITYHGPGQLVGYPHFDLRQRGRDLHQFLRGLEEVLIRTAAAFNVEGFRRKGLTGVWTSEGKLASIGVGVRQWITMHGFALNVSTDLRYFDLINPCGIPDCTMVSLEALTGSRIEMNEVKTEVRKQFETVFG